MGITEKIVAIIVAFISKTGYSSIVVLMALESMVAPVPSEAVMPFAGFLIADGRFTFTGVIFFSTLGSIIGSLISYYIGVYGGRPVIEKYGKYLFLNKHHLDITETYFNKKGDITIFVCRFIPIVRHLISIPAGMGKMNIFKFSLYTIIGAGMWNAILTVAGFYLRDNWKDIMKYSHVVDIVMLAGIVVSVGYISFKYYQKIRK
jgi:membrane protein DedA with SNARE-associated domain